MVATSWSQGSDQLEPPPSRLQLGAMGATNANCEQLTEGHRSAEQRVSNLSPAREPGGEPGGHPLEMTLSSC